MSLTLEEVEHIANLARLNLTAEEKARYREQLSAVLAYFSKLQELDTERIPPTSSVLPSRTVLRADESRPGLGAETLMRGAPETEGDQFKVPPILFSVYGGVVAMGNPKPKPKRKKPAGKAKSTKRQKPTRAELEAQVRAMFPEPPEPDERKSGAGRSGRCAQAEYAQAVCVVAEKKGGGKASVPIQAVICL
ncbi:MAG: Asp-tRNA(Asn)/Glu-tRNA(Gln) amidotransferase subunit GatC [Anaerolineales bacterium]